VLYLDVFKRYSVRISVISPSWLQFLMFDLQTNFGVVLINISFQMLSYSPLTIFHFQ
jgi:hypothetical protein